MNPVFGALADQYLKNGWLEINPPVPIWPEQVY
jgi:hypothetical protein